jgi:hypothetical protein
MSQLPILHPTAAYGRPPKEDPPMTATSRRRLLMLALISASALIGVITAAALGASGPARDRGDSSDTGPPRAGLVRDAAFPARFSLPEVSWSSAAPDVIVVRGDRCPKSHPRKIGSSSSGTWTQVDGKVTRRSYRSVICAR